MHVKILERLKCCGVEVEAKMGMKLAAELGSRDIILEGDSELVIKAIQAWPFSTIFPTVKGIHDVGQRFLSWHFIMSIEMQIFWCITLLVELLLNLI